MHHPTPTLSPEAPPYRLCGHTSEPCPQAGPDGEDGWITHATCSECDDEVPVAEAHWCGGWLVAPSPLCGVPGRWIAGCPSAIGDPEMRALCPACASNPGLHDRRCPDKEGSAPCVACDTWAWADELTWRDPERWEGLCVVCAGEAQALRATQARRAAA